MTRIEEFIEQGKRLHNSNYFAPDFRAWITTVVGFLKKEYGEKSHEVCSFMSIQYYSPYLITINHPHNKMIFQTGLKTAILYLKGYQTNNTEKNESKNTTNTVSSNEIFIVHGRNDGIRAQVENLLSRLKIKPIILQEQTNKGLTIIEKVEKHSNVQAVIVLFTSDDVGRLKKDSELEDRARQNVVFEAGFFIGKLGRNNTIILLESGLTLPSDLNGVVHIEIDSDGGWQLKVAKELKGLSFDIDMNCLLNGLD